MLKHKSIIGALLACSAVLWSGAANAKLITYNIDVTVTDTPLVPGSFTGNHWNIPSTPVTYSGTFTADDTVAGSISDLNLKIGGIDIASSFPGGFVNNFDPATLQLDTFLAGPNGDYGLATGQPFGTASPTNYAVALENGTSGTVDPYYNQTQNWVGTYSVTAVPEPSTALLLGIGAVGLAVSTRKKKTGMG